MNLHRLCAFAALVLASAFSHAQQAAPVVGQALPGLEAFDELMQATLARRDYPGGSLAVAFQGRMVFNKSYGLARRGLTGSTPMAVDQRMRIASMSKWITGAALLKAAEQGKLNLDQPVAEILAWSANAGDYTDARALRITPRHLLHNHAGWTVDRSNDPMFDRVPPCPGNAQGWVRRARLDADPGQLYSYSNLNFCLAQLALRITPRHLLHNHAGWTVDRSNDPMFDRVPPCPGNAQGWVRRARLDADPGQLYSYSNLNFCLAQLALEKATGVSYVEFVKTQIAQPLGIVSWQFAASRSSAADEPDYVATAGGTDTNPYAQVDMDALGGAGAWTSSASDYVRFLNGLRGYEGKAILKPETVAQMYQRPPAADSAGKPNWYGMGTNVRTLDGGRYNAWHHGSLAGTTSFGATFASGWTVFAVFNRRLPREIRDAATLEFDRGISQAIGKSGRPEGEIKP